jgi:hypothetical protein
MRAHTLSFVSFKRTGMGLLFGYANFRQHIQDRFAFDFKLAR